MNDTELLETPRPAAIPTRPVRVHLTGPNLLVDGRFAHWAPIALIGDQPGKGTVQLLFDATSPVGDTTASDLFSFTAHETRRVAPHIHEVKGVLKVEGVRRTVEAIVQTPQGHTPFFFLTIPLDRSKFEPLWHELDLRASAPANSDGESEMRPQAWLRAPELAAA